MDKRWWLGEILKQRCSMERLYGGMSRIICGWYTLKALLLVLFRRESLAGNGVCVAVDEDWRPYGGPEWECYGGPRWNELHVQPGVVRGWRYQLVANGD